MCKQDCQNCDNCQGNCENAEATAKVYIQDGFWYVNAKAFYLKDLRALKNFCKRFNIRKIFCEDNSIKDHTVGGYEKKFNAQKHIDKALAWK
jgi:hypothetical protein